MSSSALKRCRKCGADKPVSDFYLAPSGNPTSPCKVCHTKAVYSWRGRNIETARAIVARWRKRNLKAKALLAVGYTKRHPERTRALSAKHRAGRLSAIPKWANHFFIGEIYDLSRRRTAATGFLWHVDHIVPLNSKIVCGLHCEQNLQVIPAVKNYEKNNTVWPDMP